MKISVKLLTNNDEEVGYNFMVVDIPSMDDGIIVMQNLNKKIKG